MRRLAAAVGLVLVAGVAAPADAACSLAASTIPVEMRGMQPMIRAQVDGADVDFLLDSGAFFNSIGAKVAAERKMKAARVAVTGTLTGVTAQANFTGVAGKERVAAIVQADHFLLGGADLKRAVFLTLPKLDGGIIGQNFLRLWDVEYDFAHGVVRVFRARNCKGEDFVYWATGAYSMLPIEQGVEGDFHTLANVTINGVKMRAMFDTGADVSFITQRAAARAGVKIADPGVADAGFTTGADYKDVKVWKTRFASIKIGSEEVRNALFQIGDTDADSFDILIGADFFLAHRVMVANSEKTMFFTYNGGGVFNGGKPGERSSSAANAPPAK